MRVKLAILAAALLCACCGPTEVDAAAVRARYEFVRNDYQGDDGLLRNARRPDGSRWFSDEQIEDREMFLRQWGALVVDTETSAEGR
jgi:hypothetical protein